VYGGREALRKRSVRVVRSQHREREGTQQEIEKKGKACEE